MNTWMRSSALSLLVCHTRPADDSEDASRWCSWCRRLGRWSADALHTHEGLDDDHRCATVSADEGRWGGRNGLVGFGGRRRRHLEQRSSQGKIVLAAGVGEQRVVAEAVAASIAER
jgi:hypothetical protein